MNKLIIPTIILIVIAAVAIMFLPIPVSQETGTVEETQEESSGEVSTVDEAYLLEDLYIDILEEEMDALEIEQTEYNNEIEDQLASDMSQFYY